MQLRGKLTRTQLTELLTDALKVKFLTSSMRVVDVTLPTLYQDAEFTLSDGADDKPAEIESAPVTTPPPVDDIPY